MINSSKKKYVHMHVIFTKNMYIWYDRWYGTPVDINVDKSALQIKWCHHFEIFKFYNGWPIIVF